MKKLLSIFVILLNFSMSWLIGQGAFPEEEAIEEKVSSGKMEEGVLEKKEVAKKEIRTKKIPYSLPYSFPLLVQQGELSLFLKLDEIETFSQTTFKELIKVNEKASRPFILAVSASFNKENGKTTLRFYEAIAFNRFMLDGELMGLLRQVDLIDKLPITSVHYFAILGLKDEFTALGSLELLFTSENVRPFLIAYFEASKETDQTAWALAELSKLYKESDKKKSEWFLNAAFHHESLYAMNEVAKQKEEQGNLKEAFDLYEKIDKKIVEKVMQTEEPEDSLEMLEILEVRMEVMKRLVEFYQEGKGGAKVNQKKANSYSELLKELEQEKAKIEIAKEESEIEFQEVED